MAHLAPPAPLAHANPTRRAWLRATGCAALGATWVAPLWANAPAAASAPAWLASALPGAALVGQGRLTFFGLKVYDARLWAAPGFDAARFDQQPFALALTYLRGLKGALIAERSLKEMRPLPGFDANRESDWLARMTALFPDVADGDTLVGLHLPGMGARFVLNGQVRGQVDDPLFARLFFGIWLSPKTSEPALRQALLGAP
jgi:Chalcone isomerase-like